ncbi:putative viral replication protein [Nitzschia inconspicua]|uniref:Viral replication protein n=1 Tax=Nitzschia inconspicua TaxID=303405 RepID=A0A9K3L6R5_9STRA|nr:putative viral replication protein [Nitzschia inconspicua]
MSKRDTAKKDWCFTLNDTAKKDWCFTLNNYDDNQIAKMETILTDGSVIRYAIYGREVGRSGTPHLQGYLCLIKKQRFNQVRKLFGIDEVHLEGRSKGTHEQSETIARKTETSRNLVSTKQVPADALI